MRAKHIILLLTMGLMSLTAAAQSDIELTDSTSTDWTEGSGGGGLNPQTPSGPVTSMTISRTTLTLAGGESARLTVSFNARARNKQVIWSVADPSIASVSSDGTVFGLGKGKTTVTATSVADNNFKRTCTVTVTSDYVETFDLPDTPFEFYFNAAEYDATSHSIPNHPDANLNDASLQLTENLPDFVDGKLLRINER